MRYISFKTLLLAMSFLTIRISAQETKIKLTINNQTELTAALVDNSSVTALIELLKKDPLTIEMRDYGNMEKVGAIGTTLPRNDEQITTEPGDIILYQGNALVIYYAPNSWNFTRLGKIDNVTRDELKAILGDGNITVTLALADTTTSTGNMKTGENRYEVVPNPVTDFLRVKGQFSNLSLTNLQGNELLRTAQNNLSVNNLNSGLYLLKIESDYGRTVTKKILIKK
ncbi:T9SS type A sorting domain-containing protein [Maribellus comscasis]|uniref:T9SS type A sorting domain-containing protein n=1 Tax=Maribellus comscasis TaxID=2681766 RepID=A0A6I6JRD9_9BACT|nr:cyclophilin-like fold protein [Maribellus comscasis]QGY42717.1 T9SS type A sorting domain-containing protein [Maribellus comscasis]